MTIAKRYGVLTLICVVGLASSAAAEDQSAWFGRWAEGKMQRVQRSAAIDAGIVSRIFENAAMRAGDAGRNFYLTSLDYVEFHTASQLDPRAAVYRSLAFIRGRIAGHAGALAGQDKAIGLKPDGTFYHEARGATHDRLRDFDAAIADCNRALVLDPKMAAAYFVRGLSRMAKGDLANAEADLKEANRLDPAAFPPLPVLTPSPIANGMLNPEDPSEQAAGGVDRPQSRNFGRRYMHALVGGQSADGPSKPHGKPPAIDPDAVRRNKIVDLSKCTWRAATSPDERYRDGARAVEAALEACKLADWQQPWCIEALAAACAECSDFAAAVQHQTRAIRLWDEQRSAAAGPHRAKSKSPWLDLDAEERQERLNRLDHYRNRKAYRDDR